MLLKCELTSLGDSLWDIRGRRIIRAITHRQVVQISAQLSTHVRINPGKPSRLSIFGRCLYMNENSRVFFYVGLRLRKALGRASLRHFETTEEVATRQRFSATLVYSIVGKHLVPPLVPRDFYHILRLGHLC